MTFANSLQSLNFLHLSSRLNECFSTSNFSFCFQLEVSSNALKSSHKNHLQNERFPYQTLSLFYSLWCYKYSTPVINFSFVSQMKNNWGRRHSRVYSSNIHFGRIMSCSYFVWWQTCGRKCDNFSLNIIHILQF